MVKEILAPPSHRRRALAIGWVGAQERAPPTGSTPFQTNTKHTDMADDEEILLDLSIFLMLISVFSD
ncbi:hypothetical protein D3877_17315 [Azospirillum cavernae]|uniref:Uncharacterized protein n=1 Tax=Azospirillum cavernae TaxID=2320860 RepID=A0A418VXL8_9PROT|nr:hypothetical protein D3877_17315 [Azospirillum cavernae]